jgi:hypothetical protein
MLVKDAQTLGNVVIDCTFVVKGAPGHHLARGQDDGSVTRYLLTPRREAASLAN